jgi:hypothetical protein
MSNGSAPGWTSSSFRHCRSGPRFRGASLPGCANFGANNVGRARFRVKRPDNDRYSPFVPMGLANSIDFGSEKTRVGHFVERSS